MGKINGSNVSNKKLKHVLCYFALFFLVVLLFTPLVFKIVFKDQKDQAPTDVVTVLNCSKGEEKISSSFLNNEPKNISYTIPGNYTGGSKKDNTESSETETASTENPVEPNEPNELLTKLLGYSSISYDEVNNISTIKFNTGVAKGLLDYELIFITIDTQESYYQSQGFSCNRSTF